MNKLKRTLTLTFALVFFIGLVAGCGGGGESAKSRERVIIKVGGRTITSGQFDKRLESLRPGGTSGMSEEESRDLKKDLAAQLIEEELVLAEASRLAVTVSDEELKAEEKRIKEGSGSSALEDEIIKNYGNINAWREELKRKLLIKKVIEDAVGSDIRIKRADIRKYYREHRKDYDIPTQVRASMIVVSTEEEATKLQKELTPKNFADTAAKVSISPEAERGGDLGFFGRGDMPEEFENVVFKIKVGEISDVVKTEYGYHIFFLREKKRGRRLLLSEVKKEIAGKLRRMEEEKRFDAWMGSLKKNTPVEVMEGLL
ncbi:MAG: peptidylprolyl isomerase [Thermodesulfobacteriota bacterium]|nr:MAG: peptidylprolyl isomerase [Thermodesulfobacteriota bacterium]